MYSHCIVNVKHNITVKYRHTHVHVLTLYCTLKTLCTHSNHSTIPTLQHAHTLITPNSIPHSSQKTKNTHKNLHSSFPLRLMSSNDYINIGLICWHGLCPNCGHLETYTTVFPSYIILINYLAVTKLLFKKKYLVVSDNYVEPRCNKNILRHGEKI
jgi:hypothetical protein